MERKINATPSIRKLLDVTEDNYYSKDTKKSCSRLKISIICVTLTVLIVTALFCTFVILPHTKEAKLLRRIPLSYTKPELLLPEERDVLADIRTSFVPSRSIILPLEEGRKGNDLTEKLLDDLLNQNGDEINNDFVDPQKSSITSLEDWIVNNKQRNKRENNGDEDLYQEKRIVRLERFRRDEKSKTKCKDGEPCNNESEDILSTSLQSFWRHSGAPETVREHQSRVMRRNMDMSADPCNDFYQYACGNWAALNPIPADKAGFDTFEMLRENLDQVLKQLLTSEKVEQWENRPFLPDNPAVSKNLQMEPLKIIDKLEFLDEDDNAKYTSVEEIETLQQDRKKRNSKNSSREMKYVDILRKKRDIVTNVDDLTRKSRSDFAKRLHRMKRSIKSVDFGEDNNIRIVDNDKIIENIDEMDVVKDNDKSIDAITKAKHLYESCMNYDILEKRQHQPLLDLLIKLGGWPMLDPNWNETSFDWLELVGILRLFNNDILLSEWVGPDIRKSDEFVVQFDQSNLGLLPEYYLEENKEFIEAYMQYITSIAVLMGVEPEVANKSANEITMFEKKLAKIIIPMENRRNISELYQRLTVKELSEMIPKIKWKRYLCIVLNRTVSWNESVVMYASQYAKNLVTLIEETPPRIVSNYILWRFVKHRVNNLDDKFQDAKQRFYNKLFGRESLPPRWKNCVSQVNSNMGMALGSMFVSQYFDENSKNDTLIMTREIQHSFRELLNMTGWIDEDTKRLATDKVDAMMLRIGYPDFVLDLDELNKRYKDVAVHPDTYFENTLNILRDLSKTEHSKLGQTVDKTQWNTPPAIVNAYYSRNKNQILFPAGILQPPFYHKHFPKCLNYGGIGVVIGHEITHGFDDKGRLFDKQGNLQRWWPEIAIHAFHKKAQCLIDQYSEYKVSEVSMALDGISTQGENIADNGGIKQAFRAYRHWVESNGNLEESLPGINATSSQLFFLNFAQIWCGVMRPEAMKNKLKVAVHSPGRFRVIGTVSNSEDFAKAFNCPAGSKMNPAKKCDVW